MSQSKHTGVAKRVGIIQSNYIPWKGYFDFINAVDEFVLLDDVQFTKRDWRNRNLIKGPNGLHWLTIPIEVKGKYSQLIKDTIVSDKDWASKHWKVISTFYQKARYFQHYRDELEGLYRGELSNYLSEINFKFIEFFKEKLQVKTKIRFSHEFDTPADKTLRLVEICKQLQANVYLSGPAAKDYLNESLFNDENIEVTWMDYSGYKEYTQLFPPFQHGVSIIDLLLNMGSESRVCLKTST